MSTIYIVLIYKNDFRHRLIVMSLAIYIKNYINYFLYIYIYIYIYNLYYIKSNYSVQKFICSKCMQ